MTATRTLDNAIFILGRLTLWTNHRRSLALPFVEAKRTDSASRDSEWKARQKLGDWDGEPATSGSLSPSAEKRDEDQHKSTREKSHSQTAAVLASSFLC